MAYNIRRSNQSVNLVHETTGSLEARIGSLVRPQPDGCWLWGEGGCDYPGTLIHGEMVRVHRWMYFTMNGMHPDDWSDHHVHHKCQNKRCVNPGHLQALTPEDHMALHAELRSGAG